MLTVNTYAQNMLLKALFPAKKNAKKKPRPALNYDALFGTTEK
jgi:hypothetical protein